MVDCLKDYIAPISGTEYGLSGDSIMSSKIVVVVFFLLHLMVIMIQIMMRIEQMVTVAPIIIF